jgi:hypothetical protein
VNAIEWLRDGDPAIAWQTLRDLTDASPTEISAARTRVPHHGIGAAILDRQEVDGSWRSPGSPVWLPTLFTLQLLRATGADPADPPVASAIARLKAGLAFDDADGCWELRPLKDPARTFFHGEEEPCINGAVLAVGAWFGHPTQSLAARLLAEQLQEGGWNCEAPKSSRASFHTTICVLEGLLAYERATAPSQAITNARHHAEEYLLKRLLFRRQSTGEVIDSRFLELAFPPRYHYDILRALDYLRDARPDGPQDPRVDEALSFLESRRQPDGRWLLDQAYEEAIPFPLDESVGGPSRWNTLRALRVLRWAGRLSATNLAG